MSLTFSSMLEALEQNFNLFTEYIYRNSQWLRHVRCNKLNIMYHETCPSP
jgi:hypothetical protein